MKGTVAILEARLGSELAALITRHGGKPLSAPALAEVPDVDESFIARFSSQLETEPAKVAIFQTGIGTRALFDAAERLGLGSGFQALLAGMLVVARGPKPAGALRARGIRIDVTVGEPFTTEEVLLALESVPLAGEQVVVQRYGEANDKLDRALQGKGARVIEIPTYRWSLPADTAPLERLVEALSRGEVAAAVFTNAAQVRNLFAVAQRSGRDDSLARDLNKTLVASIGPVCSSRLRDYGVNVGLEPHPPKLGALVAALEQKLSG